VTITKRKRAVVSAKRNIKLDISGKIYFHYSISICIVIGREYKEEAMEIKTVTLEIPADGNVILGQTHFIKTAEDLYEIIATAVPQALFGIAFTEASGPCLIRTEGNSPELVETSVKNVQSIGAGHVFCITLKNAFPINILNQIKNCPEVCRIFCATANPVEVIVAETSQGKGVLGVIDGFSPRGIETPEDKAHRKEFLRKIGYKL
jgi:adenosine/AMP kinase